MNVWTIDVLDSGNDVVADAQITRFNTWSVDCEHYGVEGEEGVDVSGISNGDGTHSIEFFWAHGGPWRAELDVTANGLTETVHIGFCLAEV